MNVGVLIFVLTLVSQMLPGNEATHQHPTACYDVSRSCLDLFKRGWKKDGFYDIYNVHDGSFANVYCDMVPEAGEAWTLVESFSHSEKDNYPFRKYPFKIDAPISAKKDAKFKRYRMSYHRMSSLKTVSTLWRATCSFPVKGIDGRDQVRGNFKDFDILNYIGYGECKRVDYINIRGFHCTNCTTPWWAIPRIYGLHIESESHRCEFDATKGAVKYEDNFGYGATTNPKFRCHESRTSTTNWWFGGSLCNV